MRNNKGMALITTLILSLAALAVISAVLYMLNSATQISGIQKRYQNSLMAARGAAGYIIDAIFQDNEDSVCGSGGCTTGKNFTLNNIVTDYNVDVKVLNKNYDPSNDYYIYSFRVTSTSKHNTKEKSIIEFVYKLQ